MAAFITQDWGKALGSIDLHMHLQTERKNTDGHCSTA